MTNAEKQAAFRKRNAALGRSELRGIIATKEEQAILKPKIRLMIEELMYSKSGDIAPGIVFRLTENDLISKLEKLVHYIPGKFEIRETAGIHQLYRLEDIQPIDFLNKHYAFECKGEAA